jgi:HEAT repeat protein
VAIRASSSKQIDALIADLRDGTAVTREAAVARLTIIGARGVERLLELAESPADPAVRAAAFRTLEAIADQRALGPALRVLEDAGMDAAVAIAAAGVARAFLRGERGASAVDALTAVALDRARPEPVRIAALRAMRELQRSTLAPLLKSLVDDPSPAVRAEAEARPARKSSAAAEPLDALTRAAQAELPNDPDALRYAIVRAGGTIALPLLLRIVERVREREALERPAQRPPWTTTRAAAHVALANRGSRLALYDLRESIEAATAPLPVEFLTALSIIGDASCLEAIGSAHAKSRDAWWLTHLADAFHTIVTRERITRRHAVMKRIEKRWKGAVDELWSRRAGRAG